MNFSLIHLPSDIICLISDHLLSDNQYPMWLVVIHNLYLGHLKWFKSLRKTFYAFFKGKSFQFITILHLQIIVQFWNSAPCSAVQCTLESLQIADEVHTNLTSLHHIWPVLNIHHDHSTVSYHHHICIFVLLYICTFVHLYICTFVHLYICIFRYLCIFVVTDTVVIGRCLRPSPMLEEPKGELQSTTPFSSFQFLFAMLIYFHSAQLWIHN